MSRCFSLSTKKKLHIYIYIIFLIIKYYYYYAVLICGNLDNKRLCLYFFCWYPVSYVLISCWKLFFFQKKFFLLIILLNIVKMGHVVIVENSVFCWKLTSYSFFIAFICWYLCWFVCNFWICLLINLVIYSK